MRTLRELAVAGTIIAIDRMSRINIEESAFV
jgi:hypothetical protein